MTTPPDNKSSQSNLWNRIQYWAQLLFRRDTPWKVKAILGFAILYLLSPFDLVPDWIMGFGLLDDLTAVSFLVAWAIRIAEKNK
ncbi:MAG TPA: DUF1232 domain-containing protein [Desulfobacterales bacterium]|nr:DUF1232 domain-containing protein [Desulfobacterales bacterium]